MSRILDPWGYFAIEDYEKLLSEFGIKRIDDVMNMLPRDHMYFKRRVIFGHRDFDIWLTGLRERKKVAVLTGFMPSGIPHLGTAMVYEELKFLQEIGAYVKIVIADAEAYIVRREDRKETIKRGVEFVAHAIAWGIDSEKADFYYQTAMDDPYYRLIQMFSRKVTFSEMEAIYGDLTPGKVMAALTQAADILHLQLDIYGGYKYVLVPVGADQDPHLRLTRDLADRFATELSLSRPSSIYHKLLRGLDGNKMSKSRPEYAIHLNDPIDVAIKKIQNALTGGRATAEEQKRLGGEPWKCTIYELYLYHLVRDAGELKEIYENCINGKMLCGQCKKVASEKLKKLLEDHMRRYIEVVSSGIINKILKQPSF
ncbi:MAG: tryptophan--tRNA ligase [Desulfurococcaceae archaeon]